MNRNFWYILAVGVLLIFICGLMMSPVRAADNFTAQVCPADIPVVDINPQDIIPYGTCANLLSVAWSGKLIHVSSGSVVDISSFTRRILINPPLWKVGRYDQWTTGEEPNANLFAFVVVEKNVTKQEIKNITANISAPLAPVYEMIKYNLPEKQVSDILVARGDTLSFNNSAITNQSIAWLFGIKTGIYAYQCNDTQLLVNASTMVGMEAGDYKVIIESPGRNTLIEAEYISEHKDPSEHNRVTSPFRKTPPLDIEGQTPRNVYDRFVPWLHLYSDDEIAEFRLAIQDPAIEIAGAGTVYSGITDVLQVDGYTNLEIGSDIFTVLDENNLTYAILNPPRTYSTVKGSIEKPGVMREFRIMVPLDWQNKTSGLHTITVHGDFDTRSTVEYYLYDLPEGQDRPVLYNRYLGGNLFVPTPTPEIIIQKEIVKEIVTQIINVPVTPSDQQVHDQQTRVWWESASTIAWWVFLATLTIGCVWYIIRLYYRRKGGV